MGKPLATIAMADQHRATPEHQMSEAWSSVKEDARRGFPHAIALDALRDDLGSLILQNRELHDRIAALERNAAMTELRAASAEVRPAGGLVERVATICANGSDDEPEVWDNEARAAIREVAAWLRSVGNNGSADELEHEADRG